MKRPAVLRRFPNLRWRSDAWPLVQEEVRKRAPALEPDFVVLERDLIPAFSELDEDSQRAQNAFRLGQLTVILGGVATTTLGAVQAALGGGILALGLVQAGIAGALGTVVYYLQHGDTQREYLTKRLQAERLRGEYFLFLGRLGDYAVADDAEREAALRRRVREVGQEGQ